MASTERGRRHVLCGRSTALVLPLLHRREMIFNLKSATARARYECRDCRDRTQNTSRTSSTPPRGAPPCDRQQTPNGGQACDQLSIENVSGTNAPHQLGSAHVHSSVDNVCVPQRLTSLSVRLATVRGVVIAASDQHTGNAVAIKNIPKTFDDLVDAKRIVREIRLMRHLTHPNVVRLLDLVRPPALATFDDTYLVTDLMETDLHRVIQSHALGRPHCVRDVSVLCGLQYIHAAHVLHRDIKPSNLLINRDCLVKICDFGLARGVDFDEPRSGTGSGRRTRRDDGRSAHRVRSNAWYRAPELLLASVYSPAIDVWSVGCIVARG